MSLEAHRRCELEWHQQWRAEAREWWGPVIFFSCFVLFCFALSRLVLFLCCVVLSCLVLFVGGYNGSKSETNSVSEMIRVPFQG